MTVSYFLNGNIHTYICIIFYFNISCGKDGVHILIHAVFREPVIWDSVHQHTTEMLFCFINGYFMSHQRQKICRSHSGRAATDDGNFFAGGYICFRNCYLIRCDLIYRIFFDTADVDGIINQISAAALLTRMLTDHGTGSR